MAAFWGEGVQAISIDEIGTEEIDSRMRSIAPSEGS